jgi:hypothetical protein
MMDTTYQKTGAQRAIKGMLIGAGLIGAWACASVMFALAKMDWQVGELFRQYLVSIGVIQDFETLVDFYTHIKGIEYLICLAFLGTFPAYFKFLNREKITVS